MNRVELKGRLTKDVEIVTSKKDKKQKIARISLAVPRKFQSKEGEKETDFFDCVAFGKLGEVIEKYCKKGQEIIVCGNIQINNYENEKGEKKKITNIIIEDFYFCGYNKDLSEKKESEENPF